MIDELEVLPCGLTDVRHGPHVWGNEDALDLTTPHYRCEGVGLVTVSFSELDAFRQCPFKHKLLYVERWSAPVDPADTGALSKGTAWHHVLEEHYRTIKNDQAITAEGKRVRLSSTEDLLEVCAEAVRAKLNEMQDEGADPDMLSLLWWMYEGYVQVHGTDEDWWIVSIEHTAIVPLFEEDGTESWVRMKVKLDLLVEDKRGRTWIIDHKSCGNLPGDKDLDFDDQFGLYTYAMRKLGRKVMGSIHNAARTTRNKGDIFKPGDEGYKTTMKPQRLEERFSRTYMNRTAAELEGIQGDALADAKLAYSDANHGRRHTNPDTCKWRCGVKEECIYGRRTGSDAKTRLMLVEKGWTQEHTRH
jgi:hypothetical protein